MARKRQMKKIGRYMEAQGIAERREEAAKESPLKVSLYLQYREHETRLEDIQDRILHWWEEHSNQFDEMRKINIYMKPEDSRAYFVINDSYQGEVEL